MFMTFLGGLGGKRTKVLATYTWCKCIYLLIRLPWWYLPLHDPPLPRWVLSNNDAHGFIDYLTKTVAVGCLILFHTGTDTTKRNVGAGQQFLNSYGQHAHLRLVYLTCTYGCIFMLILLLDARELA